MVAEGLVDDALSPKNTVSIEYRTTHKTKQTPQQEGQFSLGGLRGGAMSSL